MRRSPRLYACERLTVLPPGLSRLSTILHKSSAPPHHVNDDVCIFYCPGSAGTRDDLSPQTRTRICPFPGPNKDRYVRLRLSTSTRRCNGKVSKLTIVAPLSHQATTQRQPIKCFDHWSSLPSALSDQGQTRPHRKEGEQKT